MQEDDDDLSAGEGRDDDVALSPGANADDPAEIGRFIPSELSALYDVYSYRHAAALLATSFAAEFADLVEALKRFSITTREIGLPGGNESLIPKTISSYLRPKSWIETRIQGDLHVRVQQYDVEVMADGKERKRLLTERRLKETKNYIDGHKIDYVKGRVAFDLEWNSKDQTFDRDLFALRTFHECGLISVGVIVTRSAKMNPIFGQVQRLRKDGTPVVRADGVRETVKSKYGASTTWMGKLLYRLNAGRHGGCPVLVLGITPKLVKDWKAP